MRDKILFINNNKLALAGLSVNLFVEYQKASKNLSVRSLGDYRILLPHVFLNLDTENSFRYFR